jgi:membrane-bound lytic murein transglycosylase D
MTGLPAPVSTDEAGLKVVSGGPVEDRLRALSSVRQPADNSDTFEAPDIWTEFFTQPAGGPPVATADAISSQPGAQARTEAAAPSPAPANAVPSYRIQQNDHVRRFLDQFQTGSRRAVVERWLVRSGRYVAMILDVFKQKGLPEELVFTAMVESGFDHVAVSRAGAKGLWQFMAPTARRYGLRVDRWLDERLDPEKSTVAAANYLRDLYTVFGTWELVQAAYNAGEMKVLRAIKGAGTRDFWTLTRSRLLRDETKNFVPSIHAATLIGQEPEQYGFAVTPEEPLRYEHVTVPKATSLKRIAALSGISLEELERLNAELRLKQTPPDAPYQLKVPLRSAAALQAALDKEAAARQVAAAPRAAERGKRKGQVTQVASAGFHVVKPRETLSGIAKRYGVSESRLARWNDLDGSARIVAGSRLRVASLSSREEESAQAGSR